MGHKLTEEGLKPDASKVKAVQEMPPPKDKRACSTTSAGNDQLFAEVCPQVVRIHKSSSQIDEERERVHLG